MGYDVLFTTPGAPDYGIVAQPGLEPVGVHPSLIDIQAVSGLSTWRGSRYHVGFTTMENPDTTGPENPYYRRGSGSNWSGWTDLKQLDDFGGLNPEANNNHPARLASDTELVFNPAGNGGSGEIVMFWMREYFAASGYSRTIAGDTSKVVITRRVINAAGTLGTRQEVIDEEILRVANPELIASHGGVSFGSPAMVYDASGYLHCWMNMNGDVIAGANVSPYMTHMVSPDNGLTWYDQIGGTQNKLNFISNDVVRENWPQLDYSQTGDGLQAWHGSAQRIKGTNLVHYMSPVAQGTGWGRMPLIMLEIDLDNPTVMKPLFAPNVLMQPLPHNQYTDNYAKFADGFLYRSDFLIQFDASLNLQYKILYGGNGDGELELSFVGWSPLRGSTPEYITVPYQLKTAASFNSGTRSVTLAPWSGSTATYYKWVYEDDTEDPSFSAYSGATAPENATTIKFYSEDTVNTEPVKTYLLVESSNFSLTGSPISSTDLNGNTITATPLGQ
jgi:hypothetical protein